jgi:hypothetical protein
MPGQIYLAGSHLQTQIAGRWMRLLHCENKGNRFTAA